MSKTTYDSNQISMFPEQFKMVLPDGYRIDTEYDEEWNEVYHLRGGFGVDEDGDETVGFSGSFIKFSVNITGDNMDPVKLDRKASPGFILEEMADGIAENMSNQFGEGRRVDLHTSFPAATIYKFYKPLSLFGMTIDNYIILLLVEVSNECIFGITTTYVDDEEEGNEEFFGHLFKMIKSVRVEDEAINIGKLTARSLEEHLALEADDTVEALDLGASINISIGDGDEETQITLNSDGSITEEAVSLSDEDDIDGFEDDETYDDGVLNTLRIEDSYEQSFLQEHGKDIKRMIATGFGYVNYILLASCPNVEEFIVDNNSVFSFVDGVLYSKRGDKRTIEYITKNVKHLHIDTDVTDVSSYWHGVEEVTVDPKNSTFTVQGDMLLSRRKNTLFFVTSKAEEVIIPEGVTQIHCSAFQYCDNIKRVVFPSSYEWKGWHASNSEPILITPEDMKDAEIIINGDKASYENGMIVTSSWNTSEPKLYLGDRRLCYIPADMTSTFGFDQAFAFVENFEVSKDNPALSSADGVILDKSGKKLMFYPRTRKEFVIPSSVNEIASHSVSSCNQLTEIVIPASVTAIGQMAFANCISLKEVKTLNANIEVHNEAYFGCHLLNGDGFAEPVDEEELKKSVAKEIREIRRSNKRNKDSDSSYGSGLFGIGSFFSGSDEKEVRISEEDDRKVIVDNKWSFLLPDGLELRFNSEHVDIMGSTTTANYVVEGLEDNGRFFFDFELRQRFEDGMATDVDVIGCRHDNDVTSGNAQQRIIKDSDDLFVDIVSKSIFLFNSMISIRVRGDEIRSWDFTAGLKSLDQDLTAKWDEVKALINELAESIQLLDGTVKQPKKKTGKALSDSDFVIQNGVLRKYIGQKRNIIIPDGVKEIADSTFSGLSNIKSVVVPEGVKRIGRRCFENCTHLKQCYLPDSLEELGGYAFVDCHELKEIYLGDKLKTLGDSAFSECYALKDVRIPKGVKEIDAFTFKSCNEFKHIVVPEGVKRIETLAFANCANLEYLFIPKSVTELSLDFMNNTPFSGSEKLTIYTPAGSHAQKFAEENGIPFKNAAKGKVTADNSDASSKAAKESSQITSSSKDNSGFAYATPDESLYPHYDSKQVTQRIGLPGFNVVVNHSGTDYQFIQLLEDLDDETPQDLKDAVSKLSDAGAETYKLADGAAKMRGVFHVSPDVFNFRNDRESELANGLLHKASMISALRSFAWTVSKYCDDLKMEPADLSYEQIRGIIAFVSSRDWLNYDGESYCKSLCGTSDIHVYYIPDNTPKSALKVFTPAGSLDGLRKDLEYIYPAIEKIYWGIKETRDINEPLESDEGDVLCAWCALAYAARGPFFSEDGPMMYLYSQEESEEERLEREEAERRKQEAEWAKSRKEYIASYGKYLEKNPKIEFKDKKFVFSGFGYRRYELNDETDYGRLVEERGGLTRSRVSGVTDYLIVDPSGAGQVKTSTAIEKQKEGKPVKIILIDDLRKALGLSDEKVSRAAVANNKVNAPEATATSKKAMAVSGKQSKNNNWNFPKAELPDNKKKLLDNEKGYAVRFLPHSEVLKNWQNHMAQFQLYCANHEPGLEEKVAKLLDCADRYASLFSDGGIDQDLKHGRLKNSAPIHALRSFLWTATEMQDKSEREKFPSDVADETWIELAEFIGANGYTNYKPRKKDEKRFGSLFLLNKETRNRYMLLDRKYTVYETDYRDEFYKDLSIAKIMTYLCDHESLFDLVDVLLEIQPIMELYYDRITASADVGNGANYDAARKILEGWTAFAYAAKQPIFIVPGDKYDVEFDPDKVPNWAEKPEVRSFGDDLFTAYGTEIVKINRIVKEETLVIPEGVTGIVVSDDNREDLKKSLANVKKIVYPKSYKGTLVIPPWVETIEVLSDLELLATDKLMDRFNHGDQIKEIHFNGTVKEIANYAFSGMDELKKLEFPEGLTTIYQASFVNEGLKELHLPESLAELDGGTLKQVFFPSTPNTTVNVYAYKTCLALKKLQKEIDDYNSSYWRKEGNRVVLKVLESPQEEQARSFTDKVSRLYKEKDASIIDPDFVRGILEETVGNLESFGKCKENLQKEAAGKGLTCLTSAFRNMSDDQQLYSQIPVLLSEDIIQTIEKKQREEKERKLIEINSLSNSDNISDLKKAIVLLNELRDEEPTAEEQIEKCSQRIEGIKTVKYAEALKLFELKTISDIKAALQLMREIRPWQDADDKIVEFDTALSIEVRYESALESLEKGNATKLKKAREILLSLGGYKEAPQKLNECELKHTAAIEALYTQAIQIEQSFTPDAIDTALMKYGDIVRVDFVEDRIHAINARCEMLRQMRRLLTEEAELRSKLAAATGFFKRKERKMLEQELSLKIQEMSKLREELQNRNDMQYE